MNTSTPTTCGVLLVGHGTREPLGRAQFFALAERLAAARPKCPCEPCFLELAEPEIRAGMARLARRGARRVVVAPLLLFRACHARRDIPAAVAESLTEIDGLETCLAEPLECHPTLVALSVGRCRAALEGDSSAPGGDGLLLAVGRGSSEASAAAAMRRYAELVAAHLPIVGAETCFLERAEPTFDAGLARAAEHSAARIVVLPHLLFAGQLLDDVRRRVEVWRGRTPGRRWLVAEPLGPDPSVVEVVWQRIDEARSRQSW